MASKKKSIGKKPSEPRTEQVSFSVEPGTKLKITIDVGEEIVDGKLPLTLHIEHVSRESALATETTEPLSQPVYESVIPAVPLRRRWVDVDALKSRLQSRDLAAWLFGLAIAVYLLTRLIGLTQFPIYFFTDEAIQSMSMVDLIDHGFRDLSNVWLPTYFRNGDYYNLSLSV